MLFRTSLLEIGLVSEVYLPRDNIDEKNGVFGLNKAWLIWPVCTWTYLGCAGDSKYWLLPLQEGNISSHLLAKRSVDVIRHFLLIHTDTVSCIYLTLRKVFLTNTSVVDR
jgi:hypothetical protein